MSQESARKILDLIRNYGFVNPKVRDLLSVTKMSTGDVISGIEQLQKNGTEIAPADWDMVERARAREQGYYWVRYGQRGWQPLFWETFDYEALGGRWRTKDRGREAPPSGSYMNYHGLDDFCISDVHPEAILPPS